MRVKVDESLPDDVSDVLADAGHDAHTVRAEQLGGSVDEKIIEFCRDELRTLITLDVDFADIRAYPPEASPGMIVLRLHLQSKPHVLGVVRRLLPMLESRDLQGQLWIVDEAGVRIRGRE